MHKELLKNIKIQDGKIIDKFPLKSLLKSSLFYPACGRDGDPVWHTHKEIQSFFYADYGVTQEQINESMYGCGQYGKNISFRASDPVGFKGYQVVGERQLTSKDLDPTNTILLTTRKGQTQNMRYKNEIIKGWIKPPFAKWFILEREDGFDDFHGPERFSFVFICADGVTTYKTLYNFNNMAPKYLTIYQSGDGFGFNWDRFQSEDGQLYKTVFENSEIPEVLLTQFDIWTNVFHPSEKTLFKELEEYMTNVKLEMNEPTSFDIFLSKLDKEIAKNTNSNFRHT